MILPFSENYLLIVYNRINKWEFDSFGVGEMKRSPGQDQAKPSSDMMTWFGKSHCNIPAQDLIVSVLNWFRAWATGAQLEAV